MISNSGAKRTIEASKQNVVHMYFKHFLKGCIYFTETLGICVGFGSLHFDFFMWIANIVISPYLAAFVCE